ncbi:MAG: hypothetical protein H6Q75_1489 [Firmicutes bacterium]|nr:hypothetical protein [Bacillota bacterium]
MTKFKYNRILLMLIGIGFLAALVVGWQRHLVEVNNSTVELVLDYEDITALAQSEGVPEALLMQQFKDAGINSLAVYDTTLEKLEKSGKLTVVPGAELLGRYRTGVYADNGKNVPILPSDVYIVADEAVPGGLRQFEEVKADLMRRLGTNRVQDVAFAGSKRGLAVAASYEKLYKENLGLSTQEMETVSGYGYNIVARPSNFTNVKPSDVAAVFERMQPFNTITGIMPVGDAVLGYPGQLPVTAEQMRQKNQTLYMIENPMQLQFLKQDGLLELAAANGYNSARVYVIPKDEQPKLKMDEAIHRWAITVDQERNIRVNLIRKYDKPEPGLSLIDTNLKYVGGIKETILDRGFTTGRAGVFQVYYPNLWLLAFITIGAVAAGVLLLTLIKPFSARVQYLLLIALSVLLVLPILKGGGTLSRQMVALISATVFPVLAMTWQLDRWKHKRPYAGSSLMRIFIDGFGGLVITTALSLVGGFYVGAILGDIRFLLEIEIFRGVKLTFVLPLILITLTYFPRFELFASQANNRPDMMDNLKKILNYPIYVKTLVGVAIMALAGWVYLGRSGHTAGVPVPGIEIKLRTFLENVMYARPREKEFLIGHPAFILAVMSLYRKWPRFSHYVLVIIATVGQGSLVETFAHIRTPISMSLVRGVEGMVTGAMIGLLAVIAVQVLHYLSFLLGRRPVIDE